MKKRHNIHTKLKTSLLSLLTISMLMSMQSELNMNSAYAAATGGFEERFGIVTTRGLIIGPSGFPIYAEINAKGKTVGNDIGETIGKLKDATVMDAKTYNNILQNFKQFKSDNPEIVVNATIYNSATYKNATFSNITVAIAQTTQSSATTKSAVVPKGRLEANTTSVYVRDLTNYDPDLLPRDKGNILFEAPIDLTQTTPLSADKKSVLLNNKGGIIQSSIYNIGFKTQFFDPNDQNKALGPIKGAEIDAGVYTFTKGYTNDKGFYETRLAIPQCPNFNVNYDFSIWAKVNFKNFDPEAAEPVGYYYFNTPDFYICKGFGSNIPGAVGAAIASINNSGVSGSFVGAKNIYVDVQVLIGQGQLQNPDNQTITNGKTQYTYSKPPLNNIKPNWFDLNQDRVIDAVGSPDANGYVNVWLDGNQNNSNGSQVTPDLKRVADKAPDFTDQGLLQSISDDDLKLTDIYVYRVSNGTLVAKKAGIKDRDIRSKKKWFLLSHVDPRPNRLSICR